MIAVTFDPQVPRVVAMGHAGTGPKGEDLICAGVTVLMLTLRENAAFYRGSARLGPGYGEVRGRPGSQEAFRAVCRGFQVLAASYPGAVSYREVRGIERRERI